MATARKLPSGSWRCLIYDHSDPVFDATGRPVVDPKTGKQKIKRSYASFTSDDPSPAGRREAEAAAAAYAVNKKSPEKKGAYGELTFKAAREKYIEMKQNVLSASTICGYEHCGTYYEKIDQVKRPFQSLCKLKI